MFALSSKLESLSPILMKFGQFWIYDLTPFHSFWKNLVQNKKDIFVGESPWDVVLKAYRIHLFSPFQELAPLIKDFCDCNKLKISEKKIQTNLEILTHLGLKKIEQLKRFNRDEIQRRFGRDWADLFAGILSKSTPWPWHPYRQPEVLSISIEFDDFCIDADLLVHSIGQKILATSRQHPSFCIQKCLLYFTLSQGNECLSSEENQILLSFTYEPILSKDFLWILKLIQNQILQMKFDYPISKVEMHLYPAPPKASHQLSFLNTRHQEISLKELCQKLADQNIQAFQIAPTHSYLPEDSWEKDFNGNSGVASNHGLMRPLIQEEIRAIPDPEGALKFTERLRWFDSNGAAHERDYFITYSQRKWIWIFRDEKGGWYRQGIVE